MARTAFKYVPQTAATTFACSSLCFFFYSLDTRANFPPCFTLLYSQKCRANNFNHLWCHRRCNHFLRNTKPPPPPQPADLHAVAVPLYLKELGHLTHLDHPATLSTEAGHTSPETGHTTPETGHTTPETGHTTPYSSSSLSVYRKPSWMSCHQLTKGFHTLRGFYHRIRCLRKVCKWFAGINYIVFKKCCGVKVI